MTDFISTSTMGMSCHARASHVINCAFDVFIICRFKGSIRVLFISHYAWLACGKVFFLCAKCVCVCEPVHRFHSPCRHKRKLVHFDRERRCEQLTRTPLWASPSALWVCPFIAVFLFMSMALLPKKRRSIFIPRLYVERTFFVHDSTV